MARSVALEAAKDRHRAQVKQLDQWLQQVADPVGWVPADLAALLVGQLAQVVAAQSA